MTPQAAKTMGIVRDGENGRSGLGQAGDPVEGLTQAARDLLVFPGQGVRDAHLDGHPRAACVVGHLQHAPVAAEPGAVPGQPPGRGVGHESAADVVVVAMGLTLEVYRIRALWAAGRGGGDPVREAVRIRHEAPYGIRCRVDLPGLLEIRHGRHPSCAGTTRVFRAQARRTSTWPRFKASRSRPAGYG